MNTMWILRRVNLGQYQHWEMEVIIEDEDENKALVRAVALMDKALGCVDQPRIGVEKVR